MAQQLLFERYYAQQRVAYELKIQRARAAQDARAVRSMQANWRAIQSLLDSADKVLFADSTLAMLVDQLSCNEELPREAFIPVTLFSSLSQPLWIEFQRPIDDFEPLHISALFISTDVQDDDADSHLVARPMMQALGRFYIAHVCLIDGSGEEIYDSSFHISSGWGLDIGHHCPFGTCSERFLPDLSIGGPVFCEECKQLLNQATLLIGTSLLVRARYFAEDVFVERTMKGMRKIPREQKSHKLIDKPIDHIFRVIDASVRVLPLTTEPPLHPRESWLKLALSEDPLSVEVVKKVIAPFKRTYRDPRFVNLQGKTRTIEPDPNKPRRIWRKKKRIGKEVTKIVASKYNEVKTL